MSRYRLPDVLGGGEVMEYPTTVDVPPGWRAVGFANVATDVDGWLYLVPERALTAVDTTPGEPEPGAWLIGEKLCMTDGAGRWLFTAVRGYGVKSNWAELWAYLGGPGITPRRLVLEPAAVGLPWEGRSQSGAYVLRVVPVDEPDPTAVANVRIIGEGGAIATISAATAEAMAAALLTAARAAREVARG